MTWHDKGLFSTKLTDSRSALMVSEFDERIEIRGENLKVWLSFIASFTVSRCHTAAARKSRQGRRPRFAADAR